MLLLLLLPRERGDGRAGGRLVRVVGRGRSSDGSRTEFASDVLLERNDLFAADVQVPFKITAHFALHLVDLLEGKHLLSDDTPRLVRVRVVANDL